jgi:very-short-patch-repair endonuclease
LNKINIPKARQLRKNITDSELKLWQILRNSQLFYKFRRQYPIGNYIVDFICLEKMLIIEIDGGAHNEERQFQYDTKRTEYLESRGFTVIRFWNNDVTDNLDGVFEVIQSRLSPSRIPSPCGGE